MKSLVDSKLKEQIQLYVKNRQDISDLIKDRSIQNCNLSGAIITALDCHDEDISNTNFSNCIIGTADGIVNFNRVNARNCSFIRTTFPGKVWARNSDFRHCNFKGAFAAYVDYRYSNMEFCVFCDTVFCISTEKTLGAKFSKDFLKDLADNWGLKVLYKDEWELIQKQLNKE